MAAHVVLRTHREPDDVPAALQALPRPRFGPALLFAKRFDRTGQLSDGRDVDHQHAAGHQYARDRVEDLPRREHVEHHPVDRLVGQIAVGQIGDPESPVRGMPAEERRYVAAGVLGVVVAKLVGDHFAGRPDRPQQ